MQKSMRNVFSLLSILFAAACNPFGLDEEFVIGGIDNVQVADTVSASQDLSIRLTGGRSPCQRLQLTVTKSASEYAVTPALYSKKTAQACIASLALIDTTVIARAPHSNPLTIGIRRYSTTDLVRTVSVKP